MGTAKIWRGSSKAKIVGIVPGADQIRARWANRQIISWNMTASLLVFSLFRLVIALIMEVISLRHELYEEKARSIYFEEQIRRFVREYYQGKSAQTWLADGQIVMEGFSEWLKTYEEVLETAAKEEIQTITVGRFPRKMNAARGKNLVNLFRNIFPEETVVHDPKDTACPECRRQMEKIGISEERRTLVIVPATVKVRVEKSHSYACRYCETHGTSAHVITGRLPKAFLPGTFASPESVAYAAVEKYQMGCPVYRMEKYFNTLGIPLHRMTLNNWLLESAQLLTPYMNRIHDWLLREEVLLGDETTVKYPSPEAHTHMKTGYIWVVASSRFSEHQLVHFRFHKDRKHEHHQNYILGYTGFFQSDGYEAYHGIEGITSVGCMAHARKKFMDAAKDGGREAERTLAVKAVELYDRIFRIEASIRDLPPEQRLEKRKELCRPEAENLKQWLLKYKEMVLRKSLLATAIQYSLNQWEYMMNIFLDGRVDATNNRAEQFMKDYVLSRKNFLFVMNEKGGTATATYASLVATAKLNHLDPYKFITWLLTATAANDFQDPKRLDQLMPWNAPESMKIPMPLNGRPDSGADLHSENRKTVS